MKTIHMCLDIRGALRRSDRDLKGFMTDDGRPMTGRQAREALLDELSKGRRVLPMVTLAECPDFDYQTGCPGHRTAPAVTPERTDA